MPSLPVPSGSLVEIHLHRAGERVGDDERRRGEIVRLHVGADAAFEVAVAGQHGGGDEAVLVDRLGDLRRQRAGVADAGGAAEADEIEAELVEVGLQAGLVEIGGDDLRSGRQRGLHPRLRLEALRDGIARQQAGGDQHARVRGIGAAGDGGDDDVAVADVEVAALRRRRARSARPASCIRSPAPWRSRLAMSVSAMRPSGRFGPAIEGTTSARSSSSVSVNTGSGMPLTRNMPCALA